MNEDDMTPEMLDRIAAMEREMEERDFDEAQANDPAFDLMPAEVLAVIPKLYAQDGKGWDAIAYVKLFTPGSSWTWYLTEYDPEEERAFGWCVGPFPELGYVSLQELREVRYGPGGALRVERDLSFTPTTLANVKVVRG